MDYLVLSSRLKVFISRSQRFVYCFQFLQDVSSYIYYEIQHKCLLCHLTLSLLFSSTCAGIVRSSASLMERPAQEHLRLQEGVLRDKSKEFGCQVMAEVTQHRASRWYKMEKHAWTILHFHLRSRELREMSYYSPSPRGTNSKAQKKCLNQKLPSLAVILIISTSPPLLRPLELAAFYGTRY